MVAVLCGSLVCPLWLLLIAHAVAQAVALDPSCSANPGCRDLNLQGSCCPGDNGISLECCKSTTITTTLPAACSAHPACHQLGLTGECCPGATGTMLGCCQHLDSAMTPHHVGTAAQLAVVTAAPTFQGDNQEQHVDAMSVIGTILLTCLIVSVVGWIAWCRLGEKHKEKINEVAAPVLSRGRSLVETARSRFGGCSNENLEASAELGDAGCSHAAPQSSAERCAGEGEQEAPACPPTSKVEVMATLSRPPNLVQL